MVRNTDLADVLLLDVGIFKNLLHGLHGLSKKIHVELFELGPSKRFRKVVSIFE